MKLQKASIRCLGVVLLCHFKSLILILKWKKPDRLFVLYRYLYYVLGYLFSIKLLKTNGEYNLT